MYDEYLVYTNLILNLDKVRFGGLTGLGVSTLLVIAMQGLPTLNPLVSCIPQY